MREKVIPIENGGAGVILDTCGTGGTIRRTFNISTAAALIAAGAGVRVVKHGNRSASSLTGSADVLEKLGVKIDPGPATASRCLAEANLCFAFARAHHPAMKYVAGARSSLGIPTIFNVLGPLTNPGRAKHQLLGVFAPDLLDRLGAEKRSANWAASGPGFVHADDGLDELSTLGPTRASANSKRARSTPCASTRKPSGFPTRGSPICRLKTPRTLWCVIQEVLAEDKGPARDIAVLNAGAAICIAGHAWDLAEGLAAAAKSIDSGTGRNALDALV